MNCRKGTGSWPVLRIFRHVEVEQRPRSRMRRHANQLAKSSGSVRTPRQACNSNIVTRETANAA